MERNTPAKINYGPPYVDKSQHCGMSVGKRIRKLRIEREWKLKDLARESGVPVSTISDLEHGRSTNPDGDTLVKLAAALETTSDWLQTGEGLPVRQETRIDESEMTRLFKQLSPANKEAVLATAKALLGSQTGGFPPKGPELGPRPPDPH
jgi:transcriptional regulator with XRE-family HTH domain